MKTTYKQLEPLVYYHADGTAEGPWTGANFEFQGFRTLADYEAACEKCGYPTYRVSFNGGEYFALITRPRENVSGDARAAWHLFPKTEDADLLTSAFRLDGTSPDACWLGKLAEYGVFPDDPEYAKTVALDPPAEDTTAAEPPAEYEQLTIAALIQDTFTWTHAAE